ncbi:hypothetical protein [Mucilaginibacter sp.]|uniref:hypothetical protein n=1 Tax=Mucilaginibacter sp. TaxID=1882438 RepID=UPI003D0DDF6E
MLLAACSIAGAQIIKVQQGLLLKSGTSNRLGGVSIINKRSQAKAVSNTLGVFSIQASAGDTISFKDDNYLGAEFVIKDFTDQVIFLEPAIQLNEVIVKEHSLNADIKEVQRGYREKSVFYTGTPHYYYLILKPMTFIYENFKSEVKDARRFNRYAHQALASKKVDERFNDSAIKKVIPIGDNEVEAFRLAYIPTLKQLNVWNDYELINYIKTSFASFKRNEHLYSKLILGN